MQFYTDSSSETLPRFYFFQDAVLHGLIIKVTPHRFPSQTPDVVLHGLVISKPYTGFLLSSRCGFTRTRHQSNPTQVPSPFQMQSYTDSLSVNPTQVSYLQRCSFTRAHHQATLHRFPLSTYKNYNSTDNLQMASISPSTYQ